GRSQGEVAQLFGVSVRAVNGWVSRARREGRAALAVGMRGRPKGTRLTGRQIRKMTGLLCDRRPDPLQLPFDLWTREAVVQLLVRKCGVEVSI
ncbi:Transposase, partial [mine drainage metagenome]